MASFFKTLNAADLNSVLQAIEIKLQVETAQDKSVKQFYTEKLAAFGKPVINRLNALNVEEMNKLKSLLIARILKKDSVKDDEEQDDEEADMPVFVGAVRPKNPARIPRFNPVCRTRDDGTISCITPH